MEVGKLTVSIRNKAGKGAARQLRARGLVPGVCYGASVDGRIEPLPIEVDVKALRLALDPVRKRNTVIDLTIAGGDQERKLHALLKEYQIHPLRREITHVDLLAIDPNREVLADVPVEFTGKPAGTINGGQLRIVLRSIEVRAKPNDIPVKLELDISPMDIGDVMHVSDVTLPAGVAAVTGRDLALALLAAPEEEKGEPAAAAAAAAPEAAAAAAAKPAAKK